MKTEKEKSKILRRVLFVARKTVREGREGKTRAKDMDTMRTLEQKLTKL